jgi:hypothetical protein
MKDWIVPPVVIPVAVIIAVAAVWLYRLCS